MIEETAVDSAISAVTVSLMANLATHLISPDIAIAGLSLAAPTNFYNVGSREFVEFTLTNAPIACFVYQLDPSEIDETTTTANAFGGFRIEQTVSLEIVVAHRTPFEEPFERDGRILTGAERSALRNHRYNSGVIRTLRKNVIGTAGIYDIERLSDFADAVFVDDEGKPLRGFATSQWAIFQEVDVSPSC